MQSQQYNMRNHDPIDDILDDLVKGMLSNERGANTTRFGRIIQRMVSYTSVRDGVNHG